MNQWNEKANYVALRLENLKPSQYDEFDRDLFLETLLSIIDYTEEIKMNESYEKAFGSESWYKE
jgi:hypothetical protein